MCNKIYDQLTLSSCTANAGCLLYCMIQENTYNPSRLFLYYNERADENTQTKDSGARIPDTMLSLQQNGLAAEIDWPYNISFYSNKPSNQSYVDGQQHKIKSYKQLQQDKQTLLTALINKKPFIFGFNVGSIFTNDVGKTGILNTKEFNPTGSHCVTCVGYCTQEKMFLIANSWGTSWGFNGYFLMDETLLLDSKIASSFYTII